MAPTYGSKLDGLLKNIVSIRIGTALKGLVGF
jgi:hypothetical protein